MPMPVEITTINCPVCSSKNIKKHGTQKKKLQTLQRYFCKDCRKTFTLQPQIRNKTYPAKIILNAISQYSLGHPQTEISKLLVKRHKIKVPQKTISNWLKEYLQICSYSKLRSEAIKLYRPNDILFSKTFHHIQPYTFKYHKAKLYLLFHNKLYNNQFHNNQFHNISHFYAPIKSYLEKIPTEKFPHHIFTYNKNNNLNNNPNDQRASQLKFNHLKITHVQKQNQANQLAKLALNLAATNKQRHQAIQDFMLINDSTTIATEIPVYLTNWDAGYYRNQKGFIFPLNNYTTPITGHIDILQIRNKLIHILDYKPEANKIHPIEQLTIYAMALSRKLNLELYHFKCAWFDENNYFEFFPLQGVYEKQK